METFVKRALNKSLALIAFISGSQVALAQDPPAQDQPVTVGSVNLERYQGTWYEIASIPASFQKKCVSDTMAVYKLDGNFVEVDNSCVNKKGERESALGRARVNADYNDSSKLEVTFVKILGDWVWLAAGDYWIIDLGPNYEYSVVGHPNREYGWILSRTRTLSRDTLLGIRDRLAKAGYDTCAFVMSQNSKARFPKGTRLCDFQ